MNPTRPFLFLVLLPLLGAPVCGGDDDDGGDDGDGAGDIDGGGGGEDDRMLGHWSTCEFRRRLEFTTPADHEDIVQMEVGAVDVTDEGDGIVRVTPSTEVAACALEFTRTGTFGNIVPGQTCDLVPYTLSFPNNASIDVSTNNLAASLGGGSFTGDGATGSFSNTYYCQR